MTRQVAEMLPGSLGICIVCILATSAGMVRMCFMDGATGRMSAAALTILLYGAFCTAIFLRHRCQQRASTQWREACTEGADCVLVVFASQTGFAAQLARQTATSLDRAGLAVSLTDMAQLDATRLHDVRHVLFIVSTTGEGDAPDHALAFTRQVMRVRTQSGKAYEHLQFGILALGDRSYPHYCAFGHALDAWLRDAGARPMFNVVEVDNGNEDALRRWQHQLNALVGHGAIVGWSAPRYATWRLTRRRLMNQGSAGGAAFHLVLSPAAGAKTRWQAGDIAQIALCNTPALVGEWLETMQLDAEVRVKDQERSCELGKALLRRLLPTASAEQAALRSLSPQALVDCLKPLPYREYSIASLPDDGDLELLVRQVVMPDGNVGLGSGWLTTSLAEGETVDIRVRENCNFHPPTADVPLILIGNGTGMAGLRAHLKARVAAGRGENWLLFGERSAQVDFFFQKDIEQWQADGMLQRVDLAFSRDQDKRIYVQDKLRLAADELRRWVDANASIYVCGSRAGMAAGVTDALHSVLGAPLLESMMISGRYRRDVY